jgi:hypothetical protein
VITGFNTDVEYDGVVYHVQTEDKGLETPLILSLVYDRGTILASKRTSYDDLVGDQFDEKQLAERLQKQHKLICAAVRAGRIEDLKRMTAKEAAAKRKAETAVAAVPALRVPPRPPSIEPARSSQPKPSIQVKPIPQPDEELVWDLPLRILEEELVIEPDGIVETDAIGDTIVVDSGLAVIAEPPVREKLAVEFVSKTAFRAGERKTLEITVHRGDPGARIEGAQIVLKILGSAFRPLIFHARTDNRGIATIHLQVPQFRAGRAAVLVRALESGDEAELRQIIRQR